MSAAEKLKALDEDDIDGSWKLMGVLPQIVAVVKAAERIIDNNAYPDELAAALAALDEKLNGAEHPLGAERT